jgi:hypothetical protein
MRVEVPAGTVVGATRSFGDVVLLADGADTAGAAAHCGRRRAAARTPGGSSSASCWAGGSAGTMPDLPGRRSLRRRPLTGIVDYGFSNYRVQVLAPPAPPAPAAPSPVSAPAESLRGCGERTLIDAPGSEARSPLATFNAENLLDRPGRRSADRPRSVRRSGRRRWERRRSSPSTRSRTTAAR